MFHRYDTTIIHENVGARDYTKCGRCIGMLTPWLPFKHVVKFGRPCKGCFPEGV